MAGRTEPERWLRASVLDVLGRVAVEAEPVQSCPVTRGEPGRKLLLHVDQSRVRGRRDVTLVAGARGGPVSGRCAVGMTHGAGCASTQGRLVSGVPEGVRDSVQVSVTVAARSTDRQWQIAMVASYASFFTTQPASVFVVAK